MKYGMWVTVWLLSAAVITAAHTPQAEGTWRRVPWGKQTQEGGDSRSKGAWKGSRALWAI